MGIFKNFMKFLGKRARNPVNKWMVNKVIGEKNRKGIGRFLTGTSPEQRIVKRFTDEQESDISKLLSQGMEETNTEGLEERYKKLFSEQLVPGIAQQFTTSGGQRSGAFRSALGRAGGDLASQLAAMRSGRGMQKLGFGLQRQFDVQNIPGQSGFMQQAAPAIIGSLFGPGGIMAGALGGLLSGKGGKGGQQQQQQQQTEADRTYMPGQPRGYDPSNMDLTGINSLMQMLGK